MEQHEETELMLDLQRHEMALENLEKRMNIIEKNQEEIKGLSYNVQSLAESISRMTKTQEKIDNRVAELEHAPGNRWKTISNTILTTIVGTIAGAVVTALAMIAFGGGM